MFSEQFITAVMGYGLSVIGITQLVKKMLPNIVKGWVAVVVSIIASFAVCIPAFNGYVWYMWLILVVAVALEANGVFKALKN